MEFYAGALVKIQRRWTRGDVRLLSSGSAIDAIALRNPRESERDVSRRGIREFGMQQSRTSAFVNVDASRRYFVLFAVALKGIAFLSRRREF